MINPTLYRLLLLFLTLILSLKYFYPWMELEYKGVVNKSPILTFYFYTSYLCKQTIYISAKLFAVCVAALSKVTSTLLHHLISYPFCINKVGRHLHDREHAQARSYRHQTAVDILIRGHLLIFDGDKPLQEGVSLVYLVC